MTASYPEVIAQIYDNLVYGKDEAYLSPEEQHGLLSLLPRPAYQTILDFGCGTGRALIPLAQAGYTLTGIDISEPMVRMCRSRVEAHSSTAKATVHCVDGDAWQPPTTYDAILCLDSSLCYVPSLAALPARLHRLYTWLRPGGRLIIENRLLENKDTEEDTPQLYTLSLPQGEARYTSSYRYAADSGMARIGLDVVLRENGQEEQTCRYSEELANIDCTTACAYVRAAGFHVESVRDDLSDAPASNLIPATYCICATRA